MYQNGEPIYCKEQDVPLTKTRTEFLKLFFETVPATYDKDGELQCNASRKRSVSEVQCIVQSRFPKTSLGAIVKILKKLSEEGRLKLTFCGVINKPVVYSFYRNFDDKHDFLSQHVGRGMRAYDIVGCDGLSIEFIEEILDFELNKKE